MAHLVNATVLVPAGTVNHGVPGLICTPTRPIDYVVFFGVNYIAHTLTLTNPPGATKREKFIAALYALFVPGSGIIRSLRWIFALAFFHGSQIERAARSGALCMILHKRNINKGNRYGPRDDWFKTVFWNHDVRLVPINRQVHGTIHFPEGRYSRDFFLVEVPPGARLDAVTYLVAKKDSSHGYAEQFDLKDLTLGNDWNMVKVIYSLGQSMYAGYTLYRATGVQVDIYGFPAFGLTVVPYALMSLLNIVATLFTPTYPCMFLVETRDLDEAREAEGHFAGSVASLAVDEKTTLDKKKDRALPDFLSINGNRSIAYSYWAITILLVLAPIAIVGGLSGFRLKTPSNTPSQRVWISLWLFLGSMSTFALKHMEKQMAEYTCQYSVGREIRDGYRDDTRSQRRYFWRWVIWWTLFTIPLCVPAVGGMVTVGLMLKEYGSCTRIDSSLF